MIEKSEASKTEKVQCSNCKQWICIDQGDRIKICIGDGQIHKTEKDLQDKANERRLK